MTVLQVCSLGIVLLTGTAVAVVRSPLRQAMLLSLNGCALTALFFAFQAADVALSELVVSGVALPVIIVATLRRLADQSAAQEASRDAQREPER